jgi:hypothetical protein
MKLIDQAIAILGRCEHDLRQLLAAAASEGAYHEIGAITHVAQSVSACAEGIVGGSSVATNDRPRVLEHSLPTASRLSDLEVNERENSSRTDVDPPLPVRRDEPSVGYPRFLRDGHKLIKVGWSPSAQQSYEHRTGKMVVETVAKAVLGAADARQRFDMSQLHKLRLAKAQPVIPTYQVYLCIAWFKAVGLVKPLGRSTYRLNHKTGFVEKVEQAWKLLEHN